jgi:glutamate/tyrosine decarboxylase-like PLP-dependent enzyme
MKNLENALKAWFLGPKGENAEEVEKLIIEVFRDHIYWRRNFHPTDEPVLKEEDKITPEYVETMVKLRQHLYKLLSELKEGVPFFNPRYIGHMVSELAIPSLIGYISTIFYDPNNVTSEASPVTTKYEVEVGKQLAQLFGFDIDNSWGHITSGGTVANLEALWVARNLKYYPLSVWKGLNDLKAEYPHAENFEINGGRFLELSPWQLLNLQPGDILGLRGRVVNYLCQCQYKGEFSNEEKGHIYKTVDESISKHCLHRLGYAKFLEVFEKELKDIGPGVLLVPQTKHYSFVKITETLGIGSSNETLISVPINENYVLDIEKLTQKIIELGGEKIPVIAVVGVLGTTEEGVVDPINEIVQLRETLSKEKGITFSIHCDAAYGGYFAACKYKENDSPLDKDEFKEKIRELVGTDSSVIDYLYDSLTALSKVESITVDPHKLGYVPYPCGGVVFKNKNIRDLISFQAPYIFHRTTGEGLEFIGRYILEGSKPGAAAAACYLAHKVIPLNCEGYGFLLSKTMKATRKIWEGLINLGKSLSKTKNIKLHPIYEPHTNIVCFVVNFENNKSLSSMNRLVDRVYSELSIFASERKPVASYEFIISKTEFHHDGYQGPAIDKLLKAVGIDKTLFVEKPTTPAQDNRISVLRMTCMNPFLPVTDTGRYKYIEEFLNYLVSVLGKFSYRIFVYEDKKAHFNELNHTLQNIQEKEDIIFDIHWEKRVKGAIEFLKMDTAQFDFYVLDICEEKPEFNARAGVEIVRKIRKELEIKEPIIVNTGYIEEKFSLEKQKDEYTKLEIDLKRAGFSTESDYVIHKKADRESVITLEVRRRLRL